MSKLNGLTATELRDYGVVIAADNGKIADFRFERPAFVHGHRLKACSMGAFGLYNAAGLASAYRTRFGRYSQIGESTIVGPPEHPMTMFSTHPFAFSRPSHMPNMYQIEDFARLAPDENAGPSWADHGMPAETVIGHEAYLGAGSFVRRGVTIGVGAVIGARSVVTRDVPPYAIVAGSPARVLRYRHPDAMIERFLKLAWWNYDLAPIKRDVNWADVERTLDFLEQKVADGALARLMPDSYVVSSVGNRYTLQKLDSPLF